MIIAESILVFVLGALFGSFGNVVIYRLPKGESVVRPRSHCQSCKKPVPFYLNIPILAWFILKGKCHHCKEPFSIRYALVELLMACLFLGLFLHIGFQFVLIEYLIFAFGLVVISFIDLDHMIIPDSFSLGGIVIGLIGAFLNPERAFMDAFLGFLLGGGILWAVAYAYWVFRKVEGMGGGDIKLLAWIGSVIGYMSIPFVILASCLFGLLVSLFYLKESDEGMKTVIPFGPYLALAALVYIFVGQELMEWYWSFFVM